MPRRLAGWRDRFTDELIEDRLYSLSKRLVTLCRHRGTEAGQHPTKTGWFNLKGILGHINTFPSDKGGTKGKGKGKGRGGGNAPGEPRARGLRLPRRSGSRPIIPPAPRRVS